MLVPGPGKQLRFNFVRKPSIVSAFAFRPQFLSQILLTFPVGSVRLGIKADRNKKVSVDLYDLCEPSRIFSFMSVSDEKYGIIWLEF